MRRRKAMPCTSCGDQLMTGRLVVGGVWLCGNCLYELEHGPVERLPLEDRHPSKAPPQAETLFPPEGFKR